MYNILTEEEFYYVFKAFDSPQVNFFDERVCSFPLQLHVWSSAFEIKFLMNKIPNEKL